MIQNTVQYVRVCDALTKWNDAYRKGTPLVDDAIYDQIRRVVQEYEEKRTEYNIKESPTNLVGSMITEDDKLTGGAVVKHSSRMLSLENALNTEEAAKWVKKWRKQFGDKCRVIGELKYNGMALRSTYIDGVLTKAATRGDGDYGQDVTDKAVSILPRVIDREGIVEITGEVVMSISEYNKFYSNIYVNPLSAVIGIMAADSRFDISRLQFQPYSITSTELVINSQSEALELIRDILKSDCYFPNLQYFDIGLDEIEKTFRDIETIRKTIPIDIDGMVFKINSYADRDQTADTNHHPNHSFAYKFTPTIASTTITSVVFQVGRSGVITGVAKLTPVKLLGTTVSSAVIENEAKLKELQIAIGDMYGVYKSGDVIPKITKRVMGDSPLVEFPHNCPGCNSPTPLVKRGAELYCVNPDCAAKLIAGLSYIASKDVLDISGLGPSTIKSMVNERGVKNIVDVYNLSELEIAALPGYSTHSAYNLKQHIERSRATSLATYITALCIPGIGKATAEKLANLVGSSSTFLELKSIDTMHAMGLDLEPAIVEAIIQYLTDPEKASEALALKATLHVISKDISDKPIIVLGGVTGHNFVFTGTLNISRSMAIEAVKKYGGTVSDIINANTDYLVAAATSDVVNSAKYKRAALLGIRVLQEWEFIELLQPENNQ